MTAGYTNPTLFATGDPQVAYNCALFFTTSLAGIDRFGAPLRARHCAFAPRRPGWRSAQSMFLAGE